MKFFLFFRELRIVSKKGIIIMCQFPSWIELEDKSIVYLTDKDLKNPCFDCNFDDNDLVGHSAIRKMYTKIKGTNKEGFPCHPEIAKAINSGKMNKLMKLGRYKKLHLNSDGEFHRTDGPAIEYEDGSKDWYLNGKLHRTDGPAIEYSNGSTYWYLNGRLHRTDGPACEYLDGAKYWYLNGLRHRIDGPAVEYTDGYKSWYVNDRLHRTDGPAIELANGSTYWYLNGKLHRTDGPAIETAHGEKYWYLNGKSFTEEEFNQATK